MADADDASPERSHRAPARVDDDPRPPAVPTPGPPPDTGAVSALPSVTARLVAFGAIVIGGACGGIIGASIPNVGCTGGCTAPAAIGGLVGALLGAFGVAIVAVLGLRAMGEWATLQAREEADKARRAQAKARARAAAERKGRLLSAPSDVGDRDGGAGADEPAAPDPSGSPESPATGNPEPQD
jgi:hypothetical protein